jgi:hypothetical protein
MMRYSPVDPSLWGRCGALYSQAELSGFALRVCTVYPGGWGESTVQREFLKALMLSMSATDSLLPSKLELAERIVAQFSESFVLQKQLAKGCHYHVDLSESRPPARLLARVTAAPAVRYFGPGTASELAEKIVATISASGAIPSDLNLGGNYEPSAVIEVLHHWRATGPYPPTRTAGGTSRFPASMSCGLRRHSGDLISGESNDLSFDDSIETWTVENESEIGYGAVIVQSKGDWLKVAPCSGSKLEDGCLGRGDRATARQRPGPATLRGSPDAGQGRRAGQAVPGRQTGCLHRPRPGCGAAPVQFRRQRRHRGVEPADADGHLLTEPEVPDACL